MGALMSHAGVTTAVKEQLSNVRALLNRHVDMLQDPSSWTVPHFVHQVAVQEPDSMRRRASGVVMMDDGVVMMGAIIEGVNKPRVQHPLRLTLNSRGRAAGLAFSEEEARFAHGADTKVLKWW